MNSSQRHRLWGCGIGARAGRAAAAARSGAAALIAVFVVFASLATLAPPPAAAHAAALAPPPMEEGIEEGDWVTIVYRNGQERIARVERLGDDYITVTIEIAGIEQRTSLDADDVLEVLLHRKGELDAARDENMLLEAEGSGGYVLVPATERGMVVGQDLTENYFETLIDDAIRSNAEAIVFELDSPGGYLFSANAIYEMLEDRHEQIKIAFYTNSDCFSAATLISVAGPRLYVGPNARLGASVIWAAGGEDGAPSAVDAKFAAAEAARWRSRAEKWGRPGAAMDAFIIQDREVWVTDGPGGRWTVHTEDPGGAQQVDSAQSVLALTGDEAVKMGVADGVATTIDDVVLLLNLDKPTREARDGEADARRVLRLQQRNIRNVQRDFEALQRTVERLQNLGDDGNLTRRDVRSIKREIGRMVRIIAEITRQYERIDYVRTWLQLRGVTLELLKQDEAFLRDLLRQL